MSQPIPIQLALQGGGAKIVYLLAMLEAVRELEDNGKVEVRRLSGTSAGALSACLYATKKPMDDIKTTVKKIARTVVREFRLPGMIVGLLKAGWQGKPLWNEGLIRDHLNEFFGEMKRLNELHIKNTKIITANLNTCDEEVCDGNSPIIDSILDSCGIPFCFRNFKPRHYRVDGGLCCNLPVLQLRDGTHEDAALVAVTFPVTAHNPPNNAKDFLMRLFDAGINNGVKNSRAVADFVWKVAEEPTEILGTFDFALAADLIDSKAYRLIVKNAGEAFEKEILSALENACPPRGRPENGGQQSARIASDVANLEMRLAQAQAGIFSIYNRQLKTPKKMKRIVWEVFAHSLESPIGKKLDDMRVTMTIEAHEKCIPALEMHVQEPFSGREWRLDRKLADGSLQRVGMAIYPAKHEAGFCTCVLVPDSPIAPGSGEHVLWIREECDHFPGLRSEGSDDMFWTPVSSIGKVAEIVFILYFPLGPKLRIAPKPANDCGADSNSQLTAEQLREFEREAPPGWQIGGWTCRNVDAKGFGIDLTMPLTSTPITS